MVVSGWQGNSSATEADRGCRETGSAGGGCAVTFGANRQPVLLSPSGTQMLDFNSAYTTTIRGLSLGGGYGISLDNGSGHQVQCNRLGPSGDGYTGLGGYGGSIDGNAGEVIVGNGSTGLPSEARRPYRSCICYVQYTRAILRRTGLGLTSEIPTIIISGAAIV